MGHPLKPIGTHQEPVAVEGSPWGGRGGDGGAATSLRDLWLIISQHRLTVAACGLGAAGVALLLVSRLTPVYQATASLRIDQRPMPPTLTEIDGAWSMPTNSIGTEVQMLQSRALAATVADSLGLRVRLVSPTTLPRDSIFAGVVVAPNAPPGAYVLARESGDTLRVRDGTSGAPVATVPASGRIEMPGVRIDLAPGAPRVPRVDFEVVSSDDAANAITGAVSVSQRSRDADIVDVQYLGPDPELARDVTNGLISKFLAVRERTRKSSARSTAKFVQEQIGKVAGRLTAAEDSLRRYRERAGIVSIDDQASSEVRRQAELLGQRNVFAAERIALDRLLAETQRASPAGDSGSAPSYRDLVAFPSLLRNQAVSGLLQSLAQIEDRRSELLSRRRPEDPDVQVLTSRATDLERQLRGMALGYREGLNNQVRAIDGILAGSARTMETIPAKQIRVAQLEREVKGLEQIYEQLQTRLKEAEIAEAAEDDASVQLVDAAVLPRAPVSPRRSLIVLIAGALGVAAGLAIAVAREITNVTVRTRGDAELAVGLPVLGIVPQINRKLLRRSIGPALDRRERVRRALGPAGARSGGTHPIDPAEAKVRATMFADVYDRLHTSLLYARSPERLRTIVFTSPLPKEGKTTSAANLSLALARHGMRILLIDADLRQGRVSGMLGARPGPGLSEVLAGDVPVGSAIQRVEFDQSARLDYLTTGALPADPMPLLGSERLSTLLAEMSDRYDRVIIDTPPLNIVMDALALGAKADAVVLVARVGATPVDALAYAGEQARHAGIPITGVLLNDVDIDRYAASDSAYRWYEYGTKYYASAVSAP
ncbi:MAG: GumC family protein [Gemmatimonadaceae bacterium]